MCWINQLAVGNEAAMSSCRLISRHDFTVLQHKRGIQVPSPQHTTRLPS